MRERVELLVGRATRAMWVMTFHAACARMLRSDAHRLGYTRQFTIYDSADQRRLIKRCLDDLDVDVKRFTPRAMQTQISDAKNKLRSPEDYRQLVGSFFEQTVADVYEQYERELHRANAMDFDDLLVRSVNLLELFQEVRDRYSSSFRWVMVDEYQDTNHVQYRWLQLLTSEHRNLAVVGDDAQCLVAGTRITMGDRSSKPIEAVRAGDEVLSAHGDGSFAPARVTDTSVSMRSVGVEITTRAGRRLVSTAEHAHLAAFEHAGVVRVGSQGVNEVETPSMIEASSVRPGMVMLDEGGEYDTVESVARVELEAPVFDINVEPTHNFVANGLVTHNSIYGFRGADIKNILNFTDDYPDSHVVKLEQNYRSTQTILDAANGVISNNRGQMTKHLWTDVGEGDAVRVREMADEHAEARFVTAEVNRLVDEGVSRSEIAIFYRTNAQSRVLEDMMVRAGIGYQIIGGTKFYERSEIKDAVQYLTFLVNPQDGTAFTRIANSPRRGLGQTSMSRVLAHAAAMGITVWDAAIDDIPGLATAARKSLERFMSTMTRLKERAEGGAPVAQLLAETLEETGYKEALEAERTIEAQGRLENLEELVRVTQEYDANNAEGNVGEFLQQIALLADADTIRDDEGLVTLMTLHNAKGLEFPIVFIIGMEDGTFPHSRSIEEGNIDEERRLAYVGLTRAMRDLTLTYARRRGAFGGSMGGPTIRSRFLDEIPPELTDQRQRSAAGFPSPGRVASWAGAARASAEAAPTEDAGSVFRVGEDVVHAKLGDGVVTGVEPGGIVVVRFAGDGSERKLMADYAPLKRR